MPSSGAKSGTRPSRNDGRGSGNGAIAAKVELRCGHAAQGEPMARKAGRDIWWCPSCHTLEPV